MLLLAGMPVANASERIGHRDTATTLNVYAQFLDDVDRRAADIMGAVLSGKPLPPSTTERVGQTPAG